MKNVLQSGISIQKKTDPLIPGTWLINLSHSEHYKQFGLQTTGTVNKRDPHYLIGEGVGKFGANSPGRWLSLNWVDGPSHLYEMGGIELWKRACEFLEDGCRVGQEVSVRCDKGQARSPTLVMVYLAANGRLPKDDFQDCVIEFSNIYPFNHTAGITYWVERNWEELMDECCFRRGE